MIRSFIYFFIYLLSVSYQLFTFENIDKRNFVKNRLASMQIKDKEELLFFFEEIIINDAFGYTLTGDKPMSFTTYSTNSKDILRDPSCAFLTQGEALWKQYSALFPSKNFVFKFQTFPTDDNHQIFLINRKAVIAVVEKNLDLFRQILGNTTTPDKLLEELESNDRKIQEVLKHHEGLFGILLGFGRNNAMAFQKRDENIQTIQALLLHPVHIPEEKVSIIEEKWPFFLDWRINSSICIRTEGDPNKTLENTIDEFIALQKELGGFNKSQNSLAFVNIPGFMALQNNEETKELFMKYSEIQRTMTIAYSYGDFLEVTLCKIIEE
jgi:hypothetical protein